MIKIVAENYVKRECVEEFKNLVKELVIQSRKESGCVFYNLHEDIDDNCHLTFIEAWKDQQAINEHNETEHFQKIVPELSKLCYKPGNCFKYKELEY